MEYKYPKNTNEFIRGTVYQVLEIDTGEWSEEMTVYKLCNDAKTVLMSLISRKRIRILIEDDNFNR